MNEQTSQTVLIYSERQGLLETSKHGICVWSGSGTHRYNWLLKSDADLLPVLGKSASHSVSSVPLQLHQHTGTNELFQQLTTKKRLEDPLPLNKRPRQQNLVFFTCSDQPLRDKDMVCPLNLSPISVPYHCLLKEKKEVSSALGWHWHTKRRNT